MSPPHLLSSIPLAGPPQTEFDLHGPLGDYIGQPPVQDDLDQSPEFDSADPEPVPDLDFDQRRDG